MKVANAEVRTEVDRLRDMVGRHKKIPFEMRSSINRLYTLTHCWSPEKSTYTAQILDYIRAHSKAIPSDIIRDLGFKDDTVYRVLNRYRKKGILTRQCGGKYIVS